MGVLTAVLAYAGRVALDVAGLQGGAIERGGEEQDQLLVSPDEVLLDRGHRARRARGLGGARDDSPRLGDRVDATFGVGDGPEWGAVVEVGAAIPVTVPGVSLEGGLEGADVAAPALGARVLAAGVRQPRELPERRVQEPAQPDALSAPFRPHPVHAVVPVAGAHQGEPVGADGEAAVEGPRAVLEEGAALGRDGGLEVGVLVSGGNRRPLQERNTLVEKRRVSGDLEIVRGRVGEPEGIVGDPRSNASTGGRMPPVLDVALDELAGGGPEEVRARDL